MEDSTQNEELSGDAQQHAAEARSAEEELQQEVAAQKDKYIRLLAEFENYKRRSNAERLELMQTAGKEILVSLLEVADDMDRAEAQIEKDNDLHRIKEGIHLVFGKFRNLLAARGVKAVNAINEEFDPSVHEAVANVPVQEEAQKGKIIDEVQKGYTLNDKIIRFPKVVVGN